MAKANISVPAELQQVVSDILQNLEVPVAVQNQQQQQALEQQAQQQQQQMEQQQMEQQPQEQQPQEQQPQEQLQTA